MRRGLALLTLVLADPAAGADFRVERVATGLALPVYAVSPPDQSERVFVLEQHEGCIDQRAAGALLALDAALTGHGDSRARPLHAHERIPPDPPSGRSFTRMCRSAAYDRRARDRGDHRCEQRSLFRLPCEGLDRLRATETPRDPGSLIDPSVTQSPTGAITTQIISRLRSSQSGETRPRRTSSPR